MLKVKDFLKFIIALICARIIKIVPSNRNIWVITERKAECKDNGKYLFEYIKKYHPKQKVFYAIDKESPQRERIIKYGGVINHSGFQHYVYALAATRLIGAFLPCGIPDSICFYKFGKWIKGKKVFLQHGITKEKIPSLLYDNSGLDLFICGAKPEFEYMNREFHYPDGNVVYTGFCRYDGLAEFKVEKKILVMPTWRKWIPSATWEEENGNIDLNEHEYFVSYKKLLTDPALREILKKEGYQLIFFLHHEFGIYMDYFGESDEQIILATEENYDVQDLLKSSSCLVTDYSSVAFDFAYMKKPVIYYQFDEERYFSEHYQKGYYDYDTMGFGKKCTELQEVMEELGKCINNKMQMDDKYWQRVENFFELHDDKNCERVYQAINELK